jgi:hypothetical protein
MVVLWPLHVLRLHLKNPLGQRFRSGRAAASPTAPRRRRRIETAGLGGRPRAREETHMKRLTRRARVTTTRSGRGEADPVPRAAPNRRGIIIGRPDRPSSIVPPNRNITKVEIDGAAGGLTIGPSRSGSIAPPKPKCAAPDSSATTRQGIKSTIPPAGNAGEKARRRGLATSPEARRRCS